jgi:hypothetical protein
VFFVLGREKKQKTRRREEKVLQKEGRKKGSLNKQHTTQNP